MKKLSNFLRNFTLISFFIIHLYSPAQTMYNKDQLLKSWKLQSMTHTDGKPYVRIEDLPNEVITFKSDSIWEKKRGNNKLKGKWYYIGPDMLVFTNKQFNMIQHDSSDIKSYCKIKELTIDHLVLIYLEREGNNIICTYYSYPGN
jgi:hypothetical protein